MADKNKPNDNAGDSLVGPDITYCIVERSILAGHKYAEDGKTIVKAAEKPKTKDAKDHKSGAIIVQMDSATDDASFQASWTKFLAQVADVESLKPVVITLPNGKKLQRTAIKEFTDGKNTLVAGKSIYPTTTKEMVDAINFYVQYGAASKLTQFNNGFKPGAGSGGGTSNVMDEESVA